MSQTFDQLKSELAAVRAEYKKIYKVGENEENNINPEFFARAKAMIEEMRQKYLEPYLATNQRFIEQTELRRQSITYDESAKANNNMAGLMTYRKKIVTEFQTIFFHILNHLV